MGQELNGLSGAPEIWLIDGKYYVIYFAPNTEPPSPMGWEVRSDEELESFFGPTRDVKVDRTMSRETAEGAGLTMWGFSTELSNVGEHPWDVFVSEYETQAATRPWLLDPEMVLLSAQAFMEGRAVSLAELEQTNWWRTHTEQERDWLNIALADPSTADQRIAERRLAVADLLSRSGIDNAGPALVNYIADKLTMGLWAIEYADQQIRKLSDPFAAGTLDQGLVSLLEGVKLDTTQERVDDVKSMVARWLGPGISQGWTDDNYAQWAGQWRNNPDAEGELEQLLKQQRLALFPQYTNENLSYEDIAAPWRAEWQNMMGEIPDETDDLFRQFVALNDINKAQSLLRSEGLRRGNAQVTNDLIGSMSRSFGGQVRRVL